MPDGTNLLPELFEVPELGAPPVLVDQDPSVELADSQQADPGTCKGSFFRTGTVNV